MPCAAWNAHAAAILEKVFSIRADHRPWAGLVQQRVQIVATHDLTLVVRLHSAVEALEVSGFAHSGLNSSRKLAATLRVEPFSCSQRYIPSAKTFPQRRSSKDRSEAHAARQDPRYRNGGQLQRTHISANGAASPIDSVALPICSMRQRPSRPSAKATRPSP